MKRIGNAALISALIGSSLVPNAVFNISEVEAAEPTALKNIEKGTVIEFAGRKWYILNPEEGYIFMQNPLASQVYSKISSDSGRFDKSEVAAYLNATYLHGLDSAEQNLIIEKEWTIGPESNEASLTYTAKIALISAKEWREYSKHHNPSEGFLPTPTNMMFTRTTTGGRDVVVAWGTRIQGTAPHVNRNFHPTLYLNPDSLVSESGKVIRDRESPPIAILTANLTTPTNESVIVTIEDPETDIVVREREYQINGGTWTTYTNSKFDVIMEENGILNVRLSNEAGSSEIATIKITNIDKIPPEKATISIGNDNLTHEPITVTIDYPDDAHIKEYKINEGEWKAYEDSFTVTDNVTIEARSTDEAGNISEISSYNINNYQDEETGNNLYEKLMNEIKTIETDLLSGKTESKDYDTLKNNISNIKDQITGLTKQDQKDNVTIKADELSALIELLNEIIDGIKDGLDMSDKISQLPDNSKVKDDLQKENEEVQATLSTLKQAIKSVEKAENSQLQKDVDDARSLVNKLDDSDEKRDLLERLDAIQENINERVEDAVTQARESNDQKDVDDAQELVDQLPDGEKKDKLQGILDDIQEIINERLESDAINAVNDAKDSENQEDVNKAQELVDQLPDGEKKDELQGILDDIQEIIDERIAKETAEKAVEKAEMTNQQTDVNSAYELVNQLPKGSFKDELTERLNKIQEQINENTSRPSRPSKPRPELEEPEQPTPEPEPDLAPNPKPEPDIKYEDVDIRVDSEKYDAIYDATKLGIVQGEKKDGLNFFYPDELITRAQAIVMIMRSLNIDYDDYDGNSFIDAKGKWYETALALAKDLGIVTGYNDDEFRGEELVSREHLAVFMSRAYKIQAEQSAAVEFNDVSELNWTYEAIQKLSSNGIMIGYPDNSFRPAEPATRAHTVLMIMRYLNNETENE